ncbi:hypothetical protein, partial [Pseudomonas japonica]|uniref:hypothetical protein n=1 Tax=Pseudomonas japonica TaxID=256466 RepID=UPI003624CD32
RTSGGVGGVTGWSRHLDPIIFCNVPWPVEFELSAFVFSAMHRGEAVGLDSVSSRTNKAVNHGLSGIGTLQKMWERALPAMRRADGARSQGR